MSVAKLHIEDPSIFALVKANVLIDSTDLTYIECADCGAFRTKSIPVILALRDMMYEVYDKDLDEKAETVDEFLQQ